MKKGSKAQVEICSGQAGSRQLTGKVHDQDRRHQHSKAVTVIEDR